jgi:NitT/TauT family transport system permease protein
MNTRRNFLLRLLLLVATLVIWEALVRLFDMPAYILPTPSAILMGLYRGISSGLYVEHIWITLIETLLGFLLGATVALTLGIGIGLSRRVEYFLYPFIVMIQSMPKVAHDRRPAFDRRRPA